MQKRKSSSLPLCKQMKKICIENTVIFTYIHKHYALHTFHIFFILDYISGDEILPAYGIYKAIMFFD
jgi:hypothetical protein